MPKLLSLLSPTVTNYINFLMVTGKLFLLRCTQDYSIILYHIGSLAAILRQYHEVSDTNGKEATGVHEFKHIICSKSQANRNHLQSVQRYLDELNVDQLTVDDLAQLEKELETALAQTRATKVSINTEHMREPIKTLQEKEKVLREENELLTQQIAAMVKENVAGKEMDNNREVNLAIDEANHSPPQQTRWLLFE